MSSLLKISGKKEVKTGSRNQVEYHESKDFQDLNFIGSLCTGNYKLIDNQLLIYLIREDAEQVKILNDIASQIDSLEKSPEILRQAFAEIDSSKNVTGFNVRAFLFPSPVSEESLSILACFHTGKNFYKVEQDGLSIESIRVEQTKDENGKNTGNYEEKFRVTSFLPF